MTVHASTPLVELAALPTGPASDRPAVGYHHVEIVMGMAVSIDVRDQVEGTPGLGDLVAWLHHVDATFSPYIPDSPISRLGRGEITLDDVDDEVLDVLLQCDQLSDDSGGAFDAFDIPAPNGTNLDPSGFVKGWSIERGAAILESHGLTNFTINAGGDIVVRGRPGDGGSWRVGVRHPDEGGRMAAVLDVVGPIGVATSATYERGAHIIDPRVDHAVTELASATVIGPDLTWADAYATIVFVMGVDGLTWLQRHPGYEGCVITRDQQLVATPGFHRWRSGS
jgi:FAD:protein FMN transferase